MHDAVLALLGWLFILCNSMFYRFARNLIRVNRLNMRQKIAPYYWITYRRHGVISQKSLSLGRGLQRQVRI